ncbi:MAG: Transcriptional regulator, HTH-type [Neobacillus sp.]|jgi:transcriptional regulator with XRE-family HTH domain|nr:Transcriptional regulator, HTH-type [Neobacillus sp.]
MNNKEMSEQDKKILQSRLKERRLFLNMTYQDLADKTGISKSTLQRYETGGIQNLPYDKIFALSEALDVRPEYFTDLTKDYTAQPVFENTLFPQSNRAEYLDHIKEFERKVLEKITPSLILKGYKVEQKDRGSIGDLVATKGSEIWHLDFLFIRDVNNYPTGMGMQRQQFLMRLGRLAVYDKPITKYSIVMDRRILAEQMIDRFKPVHLDIEISIIVLTNDGFNEFKFI